MTRPLPTPSPAAIKAEIRAQAQIEGFDLFGVASLDGDWPEAARLARFVELGRHGQMDWMAQTMDRRSHPRAMWPQARCAILLGVNYGPDQDPMAALRDKGRGVISVYASGDDYHDVIKKRLKSLGGWMAHRFGAGLKVFVDTAPVMEKPLAAQAGLGWQGKHTNVVSRSHGSWLFLGAIMTTLQLPPDVPHVDRCGSCTACQTACPTNAFPAPYQLDARRCISYLTIEHKGPIPAEFRKAMGNRIYGCDDCLAVCPWNRFADAAQANAAFIGRPEFNGPALANLLALDDGAFRTLFAGSPIKRIGRDRMVRNACIAAGNSGAPALIAPLQQLTDDPSAIVAEAARWALTELSAPGS